jgi:hypothetical protein
MSTASASQVRPQVRLKNWGFGIVTDRATGATGFAMIGTDELVVVGTVISHPKPEKCPAGKHYYSRPIVRFDGKMVLVSEEPGSQVIVLEGRADPDYVTYCREHGFILNEEDPASSTPILEAGLVETDPQTVLPDTGEYPRLKEE